MDDLISRQAAIDLYKRDYEGRYAIINAEQFEAMLTRVPSAQPERKTGRWEITDAYPHNVYCSECHKKFAQAHWEVWEDGSLPRNYCPNCGASMGGGKDEC